MNDEQHWLTWDMSTGFQGLQNAELDHNLIPHAIQHTNSAPIYTNHRPFVSYAFDEEQIGRIQLTLEHEDCFGQTTSLEYSIYEQSRRRASYPTYDLGAQSNYLLPDSDATVMAAAYLSHELQTKSSQSDSFQVDPRLTGIETDTPSISGGHTSPGVIMSPISVHSMGHENQYNSVTYPVVVPENATDPNAPDQKRQRACESCRSLKVRCEPDAENPTGTCRRCAKAHRECIFTAPTRKRQKRTDSRVAELEKKIDKLTASLNAQRRGDIPEEIHSDGSDDADTPAVQFVWDPPKSNSRRSQDSPDGRKASSQMDAPIESPRTKRQKLDENHSTSRKGSKDNSFNANPQPPKTVLTDKVSAKFFGHPSVFPSLGSIMRPSDNTYLETPDGEPNILDSSRCSNKVGHADVIDRGLLSMDLASEIFNRYVNDMAPNFPAVVFSPGTTAVQVRATKPVLFLSILAAASGTHHTELYRALNKEVIKILADRCLVVGEKKLELVQALIVTTLWYHASEHFEELKFYQMTHIAAVMAIDIGISRKSRTTWMKSRATGLPIAPTGEGPFGIRFGDIPGKESSPADPPWKKKKVDPLTRECRRTFLACYFLCSNVAMALRRPNLLRYTSYMGECVDFLESPEDAVPSDLVICQWVKVQRIAEEVGLAWGFDDTNIKINVSDSRVQFALRGFERQLEEWNKNRAGTKNNKWLDLHNHTVSLYMHEVALHIEHNMEDFAGPFDIEQMDKTDPSTGTDSLLTQCHIDALYTCLSSAQALLDIFLSFTNTETRSQPAIVFVRVAYAIVIIIKLYYSASAPKSELGRVLDRESLKLDYYLENIIVQLRNASDDDKATAPQKFLMIISMLNVWYQRQRAEMSSKSKVSDNKSFAKPDSGKQILASHRNINNTHRSPASTQNIPNLPDASTALNFDDHTSSQAVKSVHTPLHMLSDVAMGTEDVTLQGLPKQQNYTMDSDMSGMIHNSNNVPMIADHLTRQRQNQGLVDFAAGPGSNSGGGVLPWNIDWSDTGNFDLPMNIDDMFGMDDPFMLGLMDSVPNLFE